MVREDPNSKLTEALVVQAKNPGAMTQIKSKEQNIFYLGNRLSTIRFGLKCFEDLVEEDEILRQSDIGDYNRSQQVRDALCARKDEDMHLVGLQGKSITRLDEKNASH